MWLQPFSYHLYYAQLVVLLILARVPSCAACALVPHTVQLDCCWAGGTLHFMNRRLIYLEMLVRILLLECPPICKYGFKSQANPATALLGEHLMRM